MRMGDPQLQSPPEQSAHSMAVLPRGHSPTRVANGPRVEKSQPGQRVWDAGSQGPALLPQSIRTRGCKRVRWVFPLQGMEVGTERSQEEEDGEQAGTDVALPEGHQQDEQSWPPVNSSSRPWRSAPPSPPPPGTRHTVLGPRSASLLSLQTELLLDLVAEAQSRRLEEQRATFQAPQKLPSLTRAPPRPLEDREQLYSTILSHQCQRMEAQRSEPPLPPGGQELLELLLRVQGGGRMEEQRSRPPTHTC